MMDGRKTKNKENNNKYCKIIQFLGLLFFLALLIMNGGWGFYYACEYKPSFEEYITAIAPVYIVSIIGGLVVHIIYARIMRMLIDFNE